MEKIREKVGKFVTAVSYAAMAVCFVMVFVVAIDVILRKLTGATLSIKGSNEFSDYFLIFVTVLGIPVLQIKRGHVWVSMFVDMLPYRGRKIWLAILTFIEAVLIALLVAGCMQTAKIYGASAVTDILNMPKRLFAWVLAFGFGEFLVVLVIDTIQQILNAIRGGDKPAGPDGTARVIVDDMAGVEGTQNA